MKRLSRSLLILVSLPLLSHCGSSAETECINPNSEDPACIRDKAEEGSTVSGSPAVLTLSTDSSPQTLAALTGDLATWADVIATGSPVDQRFVVTNSGGSTATFTALTEGGISGIAEPMTLISTTCTTSLAKDASCFVTVRYRPTAAGTTSQTATLAYNDSVTDQTATGTISGTAVAPALLTLTAEPAVAFTGFEALSTPSLNWGTLNVNATPSDLNFTVTNTGGATASFTALTSGGITGLSAPFSVISTNCGTSLAKDGSCTVQTRYRPTAAGASSQTATLTYNDGVKSQTVTGDLTGTASQPPQWVHEAYIKTSNAEANDRAGTAVGISSDTIVVSSREDSNATTITNGTGSSSDNSALNAGAVFVYRRTGSNWAQEAYIKAANAGAQDEFGWSAAISSDTIVVGAPYEDSNVTTITNGTTASADNSATNAGAAYVFKRTGSSWAQEAYLKAPNSQANDLFGYAVAISGDTIVVGAYQEDSNETTITNGTSASSNNSATDAGAAYVFKRTGSSWAQEAYLKAANAEANDLFGYAAVAVSTDTIVVGAFCESSNQTTITNGTTASSDNSASCSGAAYVFKRTGSSWAQEAFLKAPNANASDYFGNAVAVSGDTIVVGAYQEDSNQTTITNGTSGSSDNSASNAGAAYVFKRTGTSWAQEAYLKAPNAGTDTVNAFGDEFGSAVAIAGDTIVVGAQYESSNQITVSNGTTASSNNDALQAGAAYVFKRTGTSWAQEAYLKAPNSGAFDRFGNMVAISSDSIVIGAYGEDKLSTAIINGTSVSADTDPDDDFGAAYVFKRN